MPLLVSMSLHPHRKRREKKSHHIFVERAEKKGKIPLQRSSGESVPQEYIQKGGGEIFSGEFRKGKEGLQ